MRTSKSACPNRLARAQSGQMVILSSVTTSTSTMSATIGWVTFGEQTRVNSRERRSNSHLTPKTCVSSQLTDGAGADLRARIGIRCSERHPPFNSDFQRNLSKHVDSVAGQSMC